MRFKKIKDQINDKYDALPKNHKVIANYFIDNFDRIPFLSVQNISEATGTSVATIVRFAQRVGFKGFLEMREEIGQNLQSLIQKKEIFTLVDSIELKNDTLTYVANQDIDNINDTVSLIDRKSFNASISTILKAERVFTAGLGISYLLSEILSYQLNQIGISSFNLRHDNSSFKEQLIYFGKNDILIVFSFPPYSVETIELARTANGKGIKVVAITNKNASPVTKHAENILIVSSKNMLYTNSFAAISVIINAITTECALKNKTKAKKTMDALNKIVAEQKLVIS